MLCSEPLRWLFPLGWVHLASPTQIYTLKNDLNDEDSDLKVIEVFIIRPWWIPCKYFVTCWSVKASHLDRQELKGNKSFVSWTRTHKHSDLLFVTTKLWCFNTTLSQCQRVDCPEFSCAQQEHVCCYLHFLLWDQLCFLSFNQAEAGWPHVFTQLKKGKKKKLGNASDMQSRLKYREWIWEHDSYLGYKTILFLKIFLN